MPFYLLSLDDMISQKGESFVRKELSSFSCPLNKDVEIFLKEKSIIFSQHGYSKTHLVYTSYKNKKVLIGYFTLSPKVIIVKKKSVSKTLLKRLSGFATYNSDLKQYTIPSPLIGQLGKNYTNGYNNLISGDELLKLAIDKVKKVQREIGGKTVYLECEDKDRLKEFYQSNGFVFYDYRKLDRDEIGCLSGQYLVQMLKYLK